MKVVIIGGGVAGLTMGSFLHKRGIEVVVSERAEDMPIHGHAFLMHKDGLAILNELNPDNKAVIPGKKIDTFSLKRPEGKEIKHLMLTSWECIKRADLIRFLYAIFPNDKIKHGREFSHFIYENDKVIGAEFLNGEVELGDLFIGADGGNSKVRELLFGKTEFTPVRVKEIVGVAYNDKLVEAHSHTFTKFQSNATGLAFGLIPTSDSGFVWFMQYDSAVSDLQTYTPEALKGFCHTMLSEFPPVVTDILESNNFSSSYVWNTRDFELLPSFHQQNVVLIGDAAHLALPFTSAGTTNAIVDAKTLIRCLEDYSFDQEAAFTEFYKIRADKVAKHVILGRELKNLFLNPQELSDDELPIPLIAQKEKISKPVPKKQIQVLYFTDPICSTCWIIQPLLRKLKLEYDSCLDIEYCMGGLLPSWDEYNKGRITKPSDAAKHWEEVCVLHEMPLDGDIWIEDPLPSSYPPSIAFKAAQMQDNDKAILFLRRIKEMVFVEKKNIIKWEFLERAAFEVGLDSARLLRDFEGKARDLFRNDLKMAEKYGVTGFPTLFFFSGNSNKRFTIRGFQPYERFEDIIHKLIPNALKDEINTDPKSLFTHFTTMTDKEFAFLSNIPRENAIKILTDLFKKGDIDKYESKNGVIWISKYAA